MKLKVPLKVFSLEYYSVLKIDTSLINIRFFVELIILEVGNKLNRKTTFENGNFGFQNSLFRMKQMQMAEIGRYKIATAYKYVFSKYKL